MTALSSKIHFVPVLIALVLQPLAVHAQQDHTLSITAENDIYAPRGQDRHYSNGVRLSYGPGSAATSSVLYHWLGTMLGEFTPVIHPRYEIVFGQNIYTPEYNIEGAPALDDRPFAGWLYTGLSVSTFKSDHSDYLSVNTGIVGPAALGRQSQNLIHNIIDDPHVNGWENQLNNEPGLLIRYRRNWIVPLFADTDTRFELVPALGFSLGNIMTDAGVAVSLRIGNHLPQAELASRLDGEHAAAAGYFPVQNKQTHWMLFAIIQERAVLHNIFLDGNTFSHSASVTRRSFVNDIVTGLTLGTGHFDLPLILSFNLTFRGREFELQRGNDSFGSVTLGIQY